MQLLNSQKGTALPRKYPIDRKRVLIVDDDKWACNSLTRILSKNRLDVHLSLTGKGALEKIDKEIFDLLIVDYSLPDISGLEVLKEIRKTEVNLPVIFMTGYGSESVAISAFKLGIANYFIKPYPPKDLEDSVLEILGAVDEPGFNLISSLPRPAGAMGEVESSSEICSAINYIKENYNSRISLDKISKVAGFSRSHFMYKFKELMGITFKDYLNHVRIIKAEEILCRNEMTVSEIAYAVGFNSLRQFERAFKKIIGISPTEHRREQSSKIIS